MIVGLSMSVVPETKLGMVECPWVKDLEAI
jgi:uncharacterized protein YodC (DUF2158 family)